MQRVAKQSNVSVIFERIRTKASVNQMTHLFNKNSEKLKRQQLRRTMPPAEQILWQHIRQRQIANCKFRRQYSVDRFVIDFYAPELKLAVEIDGPSHHPADVQAYDQARQRLIESSGIFVLRFSNADVYNNLNTVLNRLTDIIQQLRHFSGTHQ